MPYLKSFGHRFTGAPNTSTVGDSEICDLMFLYNVVQNYGIKRGLNFMRQRYLIACFGIDDHNQFTVWPTKWVFFNEQYIG